jgi:RNA polymerase sigma-70 factor (ECF subfamily)
LTGFPLATRFLALAEGRSTDPSALEPKLAQLVAEARAAWPTLTVAPGDFVAHVAQALPEGDLDELLASLQAGDLYLACACAHGDAQAIAAFDAQFLSVVGEAVGRLDRSPEFAAEVRQSLRERLLVGPTAKIRSYAGTGALGGWVRMAAIRTGLNLLRHAKVQQATENLGADHFRGVLDPEMQFIKERYRRELESALALALSHLTPDERHLLRLYHLDGLNLSKIAALQKVGRTTVFRWLTAARQRVLDETKRELRELLRLSSDSLESLIRVAKSELDVGLADLLQKSREPEKK